MKARTLLALALLFTGRNLYAAQDTWYVVEFMPGTAWVEGRAFADQPGAGEHSAHLADQFARGHALMSGTLGEQARVVIVRGPLRVVREAAAQDPMVRASVVEADISPFDIEQSRVRITSTVLNPEGRGADEPYTLGGPNTDAPIRLEDN